MYSSGELFMGSRKGYFGVDFPELQSNNLDVITWIVISKSLAIDFIHGGIHGRSCKNIICISHGDPWSIITSQVLWHLVYVNQFTLAVVWNFYLHCIWRSCHFAIHQGNSELIQIANSHRNKSVFSISENHKKTGTTWKHSSGDIR